MASRRRVQVARQQELNFLGHQQKRSGEDGENCTDQDDGSIARSSLDLSQEFRDVAPGCFSATLKRNFKALFGRLGKWSHAPRKPSSLYRYLHINVPYHDPLQRQKSKSRQSLLHHPVVFKEHAYISTHEEVKDIHLDPQFTVEGVKDRARLAKPLHDQHPHPYEGESLHNKMSTNGRHNTLPLAFGAKPNPVKNYELHDAIALTSHEGSKRQIEVLTSIHELMLGVDHGFKPQGTPLHPPTNAERSTPSRPPQESPAMQSIKLKPLSGLSNPDNDDKVIRPSFERDVMPNKEHNVDNYLSSLAAHVLSLRSQVMKGGFGSVYNPSLQERQTSRKDGINESNIDAKDVKKTIGSLISTRKFEDLADLEEFLQCYMRLYSPCFLNMVDEFFCEISNDIFECEAWFDNRHPLDTHAF